MFILAGKPVVSK